MKVFKQFTFDAAHYLPNVPDTHKCKNMHGHTYRLKRIVEGDLHPELGWVIDFADIKAAWKAVEPLVDHQCLNEIPGLENPTAENIAIWFWKKLSLSLPGLSSLELHETPFSGVVLHKEDFD
jgi:6-pyruvoyltetrahydropterin/6-carboxytetrahydropterin synthase